MIYSRLCIGTCVGAALLILEACLFMPFQMIESPGVFCEQPLQSIESGVDVEFEILECPQQRIQLGSDIYVVVFLDGEPGTLGTLARRQENTGRDKARPFSRLLAWWLVHD